MIIFLCAVLNHTLHLQGLLALLPIVVIALYRIKSAVCSMPGWTIMRAVITGVLCGAHRNNLRFGLVAE
ncbi:hypothetical protein [Erwinia tracheiphila]|uniref:hypothetical protein n=1 Tax=Erwinia tracheiphila TaxID=65700 RepID=UPI0018DED186|nr:hypothetical protein [Erwinia tracheiphila]